MACSGCAQRREAIKAGVTKVVSAVKAALSPPVVEHKGENSGRKAIRRGK